MLEIGGREKILYKLDAIKSTINYLSDKEAELIREKKRLEEQLIDSKSYIGKYYKFREDNWKTFIRIDHISKVALPYVIFEGVIINYSDPVRISYDTLSGKIEEDFTEITKEEFLEEYSKIIKYFDI